MVKEDMMSKGNKLRRGDMSSKVAAQRVTDNNKLVKKMNHHLRSLIALPDKKLTLFPISFNLIDPHKRMKLDYFFKSLSVTILLMK